MSMNDGTRQASDGRTQTTTVRQFTIEAVSYQSGVSIGRIKHYERVGLLPAGDRPSSVAAYDEADLERIRQIDRLINDLGVNLAGVEVILHMRERMLELLREMESLQQSRSRGPSA